ncbi:MAG: ORF6N domain-containing protein [Candidatus Hydrogenedentales bacterium]|jgi:hypothetical protein
MKSTNRIESLIYTVRGVKVIVDNDLAELYGVSIKVLNQAVKRNEDRFPDDFCFQLTALEWDSLRSQFATLNTVDIDTKGVKANPPQIATPKSGRGQHRKYMPFVFTEHGAIMAATILNSPEAVAMSVYVVRAFVQMRQHIAANAEILKRLAEIDKTLLKHDESLRVIWSHLKPLLIPPDSAPKRRIGFKPDRKQ